MKISKYITKYDYIAYYTKPKTYWFYKNDEIVASLKTLYTTLSKSKNIDLLYDEEENEADSDEEIDVYEIYQEIKSEIGDVDKNNPQIAEGLIIDEQSKKFILNEFKIISKYVDFDHSEYRFKPMEEIAEISKKLILENENIILFQPVFIHNSLITKPDAFVKIGSEIKIIETKGTSTSKKHHFLDLLYQRNVIESIQYLIDENYLYDYFLCLVKYEKLNKNQISFVISPYINYTKTVSFKKIVKESQFNFEYLKACTKIGYHITEDTNNVDNQDVSYSLKIKDLVNNNMNTMDSRIEFSKGIEKKSLESAKSDFELANNQFDDVILELIEHKSKMTNNDFIKEIKPNKNDKGPYKDFDYFMDEKKIYSLMGYNRFDYSGNVANQSSMYLDNCIPNEPLKTFIKTFVNQKYDFYELFSNNKTCLVDDKKSIELWNKLKVKKVYFDFETINTAYRSANESYPFAQIVTQCSIIKNYEKNNLDFTCNNLIIDPTKIDDEWYKKIIDSIYSGNEPFFNKETQKYDVIDDNDTSYIVYNKSFELSRIKEIANKLNDDYYSVKAQVISNNIYDIADFFKVSSSNGYNIFFKELGGFYSIKKVLPLIKKYNKEVFDLTKCLDYTTLEIGNGKQCQDKTIQRFFLRIEEDEWNIVSNDLKIYCENDVRAMIAVEYFIENIINKKLNFDDK